MKQLGSIFTAALLGSLLLPAGAQAQELVIGYAMDKTGPFVSLSNGNEIGADIAVDEINAKGGINGKKLRIVKFDAGGNPKDAVTAVRRFAQDDKALAVVGPFSSSQVQVAAPAAQREGVVIMSMASSAPGLTKDFPYAFRNTVDEGKVIDYVMEILAQKKLPMKSGAIAYGTDDAVSKSIGTKVLPAVFERYKMPVKVTVDFQVKAFDLSPQVSQIVKANPDIVGLGSPPDAAIKLATELKRQGYTGRVIGGSTFADPDLPRRMAPAGDKMTIGTAYFPDLNARTKAFAAEYAKRAKAAGVARIETNQFDAATYDIVLMYADALRATKATGNPANVAKERAAVRDYLAKLKNFPGLEGDISFDQNREALKPIYIIEAKNGAWTLLGTGRPKVK